LYQSLRETLRDLAPITPSRYPFFQNVSPQLQGIVKNANEIADAWEHQFVTPLHILLSLVQYSEPWILSVTYNINFPIAQITAQIEHDLRELKT